MTKNGDKRQINIGYVVIIAIVAIAGFFIGSYYSNARISRKEEPSMLVKPFPAERHIDKLKALTGLDDPEKLLIDDLIANPELIPHDPVLGGTMGFYDRDEIYILNDQWVLASFEDGHIGGYLLLEYDIDSSKEIEWIVLSSYLE